MTLPSTATTQARVKVEAVGNIFFDVSDANFTTSSGNASPVAADDVASTPVDTAVQIDVLANEFDADGTLDATSVAIVAAAQHASTSASRTGVATYTPAPGYLGPTRSTTRWRTTMERAGPRDGEPHRRRRVGHPRPVVVHPAGGDENDRGTVASLAADDDSFLVVTSSKTTPRTATWYGTFTGVDDDIGSLDATPGSKASATCTQTTSIWRWTDSTWVDLDSRRWGRPNRRSRTSARPARSAIS